MGRWDETQYLKFSDERTRAAPRIAMPSTKLTQYAAMADVYSRSRAYLSWRYVKDATGSNKIVVTDAYLPLIADLIRG